ncbi:50S ribosomal protein L31 [Candidatus Babeliales bacterium]|nr:50S ribosomal protein L31 [Candidatus Babeliales bacterium]
MKQGLHPELHEVTASCACGYSFKTSSTSTDIATTICSHCHPFFTGAQKFIDTAGRIEKFEQRYNKQKQAAPKKPASKSKAVPKKKAK